MNPSLAELKKSHDFFYKKRNFEKMIILNFRSSQMFSTRSGIFIKWMWRFFSLFQIKMYGYGMRLTIGGWMWIQDQFSIVLFFFWCFLLNFFLVSVKILFCGDSSGLFKVLHKVSECRFLFQFIFLKKFIKRKSKLIK